MNFCFRMIVLFLLSRDAMITVAVNSLTSFASGFVIFMFLVISILFCVKDSMEIFDWHRVT